MTANTLTWLALLALTAMGFTASERLGAAAALPILVLAASKSSLVGLRFMGLARAHLAVRAAFVLLLGGLLAALFVAQRA